MLQITFLRYNIYLSIKRIHSNCTTMPLTTPNLHLSKIYHTHNLNQLLILVSFYRTLHHEGRTTTIRISPDRQQDHDVIPRRSSAIRMDITLNQLLILISLCRTLYHEGRTTIRNTPGRQQDHDAILCRSSAVSRNNITPRWTHALGGSLSLRTSYPHHPFAAHHETEAEKGK